MSNFKFDENTQTNNKLKERRIEELINILKNILGYNGSELRASNIDFTQAYNKRIIVKHFLNNCGMVFFFLNVLFDKDK